MRIVGLGLLLALQAGCTVVDAPETLEELLVFGFTRFDDPPSSEAVAEGVGPLVDLHADELVDGYRVDELTQDDLDRAGVDRAIEEGILGTAATIPYALSVQEIARAWTFPHMDEVVGSTVAFEVRHEDGTRACFLAHDCDTYALDAWRQSDLGILGVSEQTFHRDFAWVARPDAGPALVIRDLAPEGLTFETTVVDIRQQFSYTVLLPGEPTLRLDTFWVDAEVIGLDVPDYLAIQMAVKEMGRTAEEVTAWAEANPGR